MKRPDDQARAFEAQRPRLLRLAYRMLGTFAEAEDVVQDAWLRWAKVEEAVDTPAAFLTRVVTRLCLDRMKSARSRRETYYGAWLPEPLMEAAEDVVEDTADDLTLTLMLALERLSPLERAAFLLHDIFGVSLNEVAGTLDRDPAAVRQLAARARKHVEAGRPRYKVEEAEGDRIARAFFAASRDGDIATLKTLLADDVVILSDGGGNVLAFRNPIVGIAKALRLFAGLKRKYARGTFTPPMTLLKPMRIDGLPGYVSIDRGAVFQTTALNIVDGRITDIYIVRNPDKLRHVAQALMIDPAVLGA